MGRQTAPIPDILPIKYLKLQQSNSTMYNYFIQLRDYVKYFQNKNPGPAQTNINSLEILL